MLASSDESRESLTGKWFLRATVEASKQKNFTFFNFVLLISSMFNVSQKRIIMRTFSVHPFTALMFYLMKTQIRKKKKKNPIGQPGLFQIKKKNTFEAPNNSQKFPLTPNWAPMVKQGIKERNKGGCLQVRLDKVSFKTN